MKRSRFLLNIFNPISNSWVVIFIFFVFRLPNIRTGLNDAYQFRQTQTAWGIREVSKHGLNFFHLPLPVLGPPYQVPFEFPLFQNIAGIFAKFGHLDPATAGRLISLIFYCLDLFLLTKLAKILMPERLFLIFLPLLMITPYALEWSDACLIESLAIFLLLASLVSFNIYISFNQKRYLWISIFCFSLGALVKITTIIPLGFLLFIFFLKQHKLKLLSSKNLITYFLFGIALAPSLAWTRYADEVKGESHLTSWLTSKRLMYWNFGTFQSRFKVTNLLAVGGRLWLIGGVAFLIALSFKSNRKNVLDSRLLLILCVLFPVGVYFNLYVVHDYYYLAIFPFFVLSIAYNSFSSSCLVFDRRVYRNATVVAMSTLFLLWIVQFPQRNYLNILRQDRSYVSQIAIDIKKFTKPADQILEVGCDWDPSILYESDRYGIAAPSWTGNVQSTIDFLTQEKMSKFINFVAVCNQLAVAQQIDGLKFSKVTENLYRIEN